MPLIETIEEEGVDKDDDDEANNRPLVGYPKSQRVVGAWEGELIEPICRKNTSA